MFGVSEDEEEKPDEPIKPGDVVALRSEWNSESETLYMTVSTITPDNLNATVMWSFGGELHTATVPLICLWAVKEEE